MKGKAFTTRLAQGEFALKPLDLDGDIAVIQPWVSAARARFWGMQGYDEAKVRSFYADLRAGGHAEVYLGLHEGEPAFLVESYAPEHDPVGQCYRAEAGDRGMHLLVRPPGTRVPGFTTAVMRCVMRFMFEHENAERVVVEPDERNGKIHALNQRVGFFHERVIQMGGKRAYLAFCTREQLAAAEALLDHPGPVDLPPEAAVAALDPSAWSLVNRLLVRKMLAEFAHECLFEPEEITDGGEADETWRRFRLTSSTSEYRYKARRMALNHWLIEASSIARLINGETRPLDALAFVLEFQPLLKMSREQLPVYLEEIASTLCGSVYKMQRPQIPGARDLVDADFQQLEAAMAEGHPCFVANNGRIGFDSHDYHRYAPETGEVLRLIWLAAHRDRAGFSAGAGLDYESLLASELDRTTLDRFAETLRGRGLDPEAYVLLPVHPWQWFNKLATVFASEIASQRLVYLGQSDDWYQAQQSIRTFFNRSQPQKCFVKTALSVLNMGFMRGLSSHYMASTPAINDWVYALVDGDPFLKDKRFRVLREVAAVGYRHPHFENEEVGDSPYRKMLAALWRESPTTKIARGERLMTMAALLHVDANGAALLPALIRASGLRTEDWLRHYLDVYLAPIMHCLHQHNMVFMPHGENLILVLRDHVPVGAFMKDIGEEVCLLNDKRELPETVRRISVKVPPEEEVLSIFTDVFDCFFRFLAQILLEHEGLPERSFWALVADCVHRYQDSHPQLRESFARRDLFAFDFALSCLNRLQLRNNRQMIDLSNPSSLLQFAGRLANPLAAFSRNPGAGHDSTQEHGDARSGAAAENAEADCS